jgi:hypothetical protein
METGWPVRSVRSPWKVALGAVFVSLLLTGGSCEDGTWAPGGPQTATTPPGPGGNTTTNQAPTFAPPVPPPVNTKA